MASFVEDWTKTLVCQICQDHARPGKRQWYRCLKLHQICQKCKAKTEKCSCGKLISEEYCKMTEKWLSVKGLKFNCANTKHGCKEVLAENALEDHESECIFRLVLCPFNAMLNECEAEVTFKDVIQHFEKQHYKLEDFNPTQKLNTFKMTGEDGYFLPEKISVNDRMFLFCDKTESSNLYQWVYLLGSPTEAKHFAYTLKFHGKDTTVTFEGKVAAIDESFDELTGKCFVMPHKNFKAQFVDEDGKYEYSLKIRNLKEEAKDDNYESGISDNDEDAKA